MKTRKQAEARANELCPDRSEVFGLVDRAFYAGFLQCWEEMQQDKQTCGFCIEPKQEQNELLSEMMRKDEEDGVYDEFNRLLTVKQAESICIGFYNDLVRHLESDLSTELFHGKIVFNKHLNKALK